MSVTERALLVVAFAFALAAATGVLCLTLGFGPWAVLAGFGVAWGLSLTFGPWALRRLHHIERG